MCVLSLLCSGTCSCLSRGVLTQGVINHVFYEVTHGNKRMHSQRVWAWATSTQLLSKVFISSRCNMSPKGVLLVTAGFALQLRTGRAEGVAGQGCSAANCRSDTSLFGSEWVSQWVHAFTLLMIIRDYGKQLLCVCNQLSAMNEVSHMLDLCSRDKSLYCNKYCVTT